jgi:hypothetical protein
VFEAQVSKVKMIESVKLNSSTNWMTGEPQSSSLLLVMMVVRSY